MPPKKKANPTAEAADPSDELQNLLQGLGVKKPAPMADALKECGIETRSDLAGLDEELRKELDGEMKAKGISIGDRAKLKKAVVEVNSVTVPIGNSEVNVPQLVPGQAMQTASKLDRVYMGMGWTGKGSQGVDVDASCVAFSGGAVADIISYQKLRNETKSCVHTGDVLSGEAGGKFEDMERVYVWLTKLPQSIDCLVFVANVYTNGVSFANIENAYVRLVNADTDQELARVPLSGGGLKGNALVFAKIYRTAMGTGKTPCPWQFLSLGMPSTVAGATSVNQMVPMLQSTGSAYPPPYVNGGSPAKPAGGKPVGGKPPLPAKKPQKPRSVLPCVALAVAGAAGIAAATAIYLNPELTADMMNSEVFTSCADFSADALEVVSEPLAGAGDLLLDGAGEVYGWAGGVIENVDVPGYDQIGDGLGTAGDFAGDGLSFVADTGGDAFGAAGDFVTGGDAGNTLADTGGTIADAGGYVADGVGGFAGNVANTDVGSAAIGYGEDAGEELRDGIGAAGDMDTSCCEQVLSALSGLFSGLGDHLGEGVSLVGDAIGVSQDTE